MRTHVASQVGQEADHRVLARRQIPRHPGLFTGAHRRPESDDLERGWSLWAAGARLRHHRHHVVDRDALVEFENGHLVPLFTRVLDLPDLRACRNLVRHGKAEVHQRDGNVRRRGSRAAGFPRDDRRSRRWTVCGEAHDCVVARRQVVDHLAIDTGGAAQQRHQRQRRHRIRLAQRLAQLLHRHTLVQPRQHRQVFGVAALDGHRHHPGWHLRRRLHPRLRDADRHHRDRRCGLRRRPCSAAARQRRNRRTAGQQCSRQDAGCPPRNLPRTHTLSPL